MIPGGPTNGRGLPLWVYIFIALVGVCIIIHEVVVPDEPRWLAVLAAMVMMGLMTPDIFDRWRKGS